MRTSFRTGLLACAIGMLATGSLQAEAPGVAELIRQAHFWATKGRDDLARQALNRALAIDPGNSEAKAMLAGPPPKPAREAAATASPAPRAPRTADAGPKAPADQGGRARAAGFDALDDGDLAAATARFDAALKAKPGDSDATGGLGLVRLRQNRFAEAHELLARAARSGTPGKWSSALEAAGFYADLKSAEQARDAGDNRKAETIARRLAGSGYKDSRLAQTLLGDVLAREGRYDDAEAAYTQSGTKGAALADLHARIARGQAQQALAAGDAAGAERFFQSALVSDPNDVWMRYEYARFLVSQGRAPAATALMQPLASGSSVDGLYATALIASQTGRGMDAAGMMSRIPAARLTPAMKAFLIDTKIDEAADQARSLARNGRSGEALASLQALAARNTLSVGALGTLAGVFAELGDTASAASLADRAMALPLAEPEQYAGVVTALSQAGRDADAAAIVQRFAADPATASAAGRLGALLAAAQADRLRLAGQNAAAFDVLRAGWAAAPNDPGILAALGRLYQGGDMPGQAEQVYDMLLAQKPDDPAVLTSLAGAAAQARDLPKARSALARAIALAPSDPETYLAAAHVEEAGGDKKAALRYLKQARALQGASASFQGGAFPEANPFGRSAQGVGAPVAPNPFALPSRASSRALASTPPSYVPVAQSSSFPAPAQSVPAMPALPGFATPLPAGDPAMGRIDREIADLSGDTGPAFEGSTSYRNRSGEAGLSKLDEIDAKVSASVGVAGGRATLSAAPVVLDAGTASASGTARFGTNPTAEAEGIVAQEPSRLVSAGTQHQSGVAVSAAFKSNTLEADIGSTPIGFDKTHVQGGVRWSPKLGDDVTLSVHGEDRPVTDSLASYAGAEDPVTGQHWGSVMAAGGGASLSYDHDGSGVYADATYRHYEGENVASNHAIEANAGGYLRAYHTDATTVTVGANINYQNYANNQNEFSFGYGGYFSPQSFISVALPVHYSTKTGPWTAHVDLSPGFQSFRQDDVAVYPTLAGAQAELDGLKAQDSDVRSRYDSLSKTGLAFAGSAGASYRVSDTTSVGSDISYTTFGVYNEFKAMLQLKHTLGGEGQ